jgi:hypothetical protein
MKSLAMKRQNKIARHCPAEVGFSTVLERRIINYLSRRQLSNTRSLQVSVIAGTAIVRGRVTDERNRIRIRECCRHVAGIYAVIDRIEVVAVQPARAAI